MSDLNPKLQEYINNDFILYLLLSKLKNKKTHINEEQISSLIDIRIEIIIEEFNSNNGVVNALTIQKAFQIPKNFEHGGKV